MTAETSSNKYKAISECDVRFMQQIARGKTTQDIGLTDFEEKQTLVRIRNSGVDVPLGQEWFASRAERRAIYSMDISQSRQEAAGKAKMNMATLKVYISRLKSKGITVRELPTKPR